MQMLTKICWKSGSSLSFSYENTVGEGKKLRPLKEMRRNDRFVHERLSEFCLKHAHHAFN